MKKQILLVSALFTGWQAMGQPMLPLVPDNSDKPVKLQDAVKAYENRFGTPSGKTEKEGKRVKEGKDYHFGRWFWYWSNHTDANDNIVSTAKTFEEWQRFHAPKQHKTTASKLASNWSFQGPTTSGGGYSGIGRINVVAFHPTDANTIYIGSAGGGAWKTTNNGASWVSLSHMLPVLGVSDIDVNPQNPQTIYMCTGDRDASDTYSVGVMKSTDGGVTWDTTGLKWQTNQYRLANGLVINPVDTNSITLAASDGIYKSYNAGTTWSRVVNGPNFKQIVAHPTDTNVLYATTYSYGSAQIYRSANGGRNWNSVASPATAWRIELATSPKDVNVVMAVVAKTSGSLGGIYKSTDTGKTFSIIFNPGSDCSKDLLTGDVSGTINCGNQGWYDLCIAIDPNNSNNVTVGGVNTWFSTDGGINWGISTNWYSISGIAEVHADKHYMLYHPTVAGRLYQCNDGGIYYTDNPMANNSLWTDITNGMGITQFYRNAVSPISHFILGGAQDNGTKGNRFAFWDDENGGDGMDCQVDYTDSTTYYTSTQYGNISRHSATLGNEFISGNIPGNPDGAWITPYIVSPHDPSHLLAGYQHIYFSNDYGSSWYSIQGSALQSGTNLIRIAMTPASTSTIYAIAENQSNNAGRVYYTHSFTPGNTATFTLLSPPFNGKVSDIKVDPTNKDRFWLTFSGYGGPQVAEYNAGTWTQIKTGLPDVPVHCIEIDTMNKTMFIGTDIGVFYMDTATKQWEAFNDDDKLPSIEVTDIDINYSRKELWISTYGRGMWMSSDLGAIGDTTTDTPISVQVIPYAHEALEIYPNPNTGRFVVNMDAQHFANIPVAARMIDNAGKTVWRNNGTTNAAGALMVNAQGLPAGIYIFEVSSADMVIGRKRIAIE
ncbi:MAG TPA: T9SS type A sorting domain-containing protein [Flavipsychrobacter sp.]